jgi:predicted acyltransferase
MSSIYLFENFSQSPTAPASRLVEITPANDDLIYACRMLFVGTGGAVVVRDLFGTVVTHQNVVSGSYLGPFVIDRVTAATTATGIIEYV